MSHYPATQELFVALLNHYWKCRDEGYPKTIQLAPKGYCISYKALIHAAGVPLNPKHAGGPLFEIAAYYWQHYSCPLHALVVNQETGYPGGESDVGKGYWGAPGSSGDVRGWAEVDVPSCYDCSSLPRKAANIGP